MGQKQQFTFWNELPSTKKWLFKTCIWLDRYSSHLWHWSPIIVEDFATGADRLKSRLLRLAETLELVTPGAEGAVIRHSQRLRSWMFFAVPLSGLIYVGTSVLVLFPVVALIITILNSMHIGVDPSNNKWSGLIPGSILLSTTIAICAISMSLASRIAETITARFYADTFCVRSLIYINAELRREDVLIDPEWRIHLLKRIDGLCRCVSLLPLRFTSRDQAVLSWTTEHFRQINHYIRERERWAISPTANTLEQLREDFALVARHFIAGTYGEIVWTAPAVTNTAGLPTSTRRAQAIATTGKVIGFFIPLILMGWLWLQPGDRSGHLDRNVIALVFLSWLMLGVDNLLRLGITAGLANLAKGIKELK